MGSQVAAICECGVNKTILIGGGKLTFTYLEYFPFLCEDCADVVEGNLKGGLFKNKELTCPKCKGKNVIPYNDPRIIGRKGECEVANSFDNMLTDGDYKCPKCKKMSLKFFPCFYMWD